SGGGANDKPAEPPASAAAANSIGSTIAGWSFSGVLTLVGIGPQARRGTATSGHADLRAGGEQQRVAVRWRTRHPSPAATTPLAPARFSVCGPSRATGRLLRGDGRTALRRRDVRAACGIRVRRHSAQCFLGVGRRAYRRGKRYSQVARARLACAAKRSLRRAIWMTQQIPLAPNRLQRASLTATDDAHVTAWSATSRIHGRAGRPDRPADPSRPRTA